MSKDLKKHLIIIGGGIGGLYAASKLISRYKKVTLIEKGNELGGLARSFKYKNGYIEKFYHYYGPETPHTCTGSQIIPRRTYTTAAGSSSGTHRNLPAAACHTAAPLPAGKNAASTGTQADSCREDSVCSSSRSSPFPEAALQAPPGNRIPTKWEASQSRSVRRSPGSWI